MIFIYLEALLKRRSHSASCECKLPEYDLKKTFAKPTSEVCETGFDHP